MHIISGKYEMSELKKEQNVKYLYFLLLKNCTWSNKIPNIRKKVKVYQQFMYTTCIS